MARSDLAKAEGASQQPGRLELMATPDNVKVGEMIRLTAVLDTPSDYT